MDITCFNWIKLVQKSELPPYAKYLAHYLSTYMNQNQDVAWPSQSRIKAETSLSHSTVLKYLKVLEQEKWVTREKGNSTTNTRYVISVPAPAAIAVASSTLKQSEESVRVEKGRSRDNLRRSPDDLGVGRDTTSNNNSNNKLIKGCSLFDKFWDAYPRKTAKKNAYRRWLKVSEEDKQKAISYLQKQPFKDTMQKYIPHAATFLSGERWNDGIETETKVVFR